ncbi:nitroreductase family protein [uncultured Mailhella sp.]|uniref:nitroreductase family protein n=1 Tax=uncultured Mailhella sp. TaxID=1981031 RepID=UPI0025F27567|nr:nitroreductase family protein [uncultured Mailhella sp.]
MESTDALTAIFTRRSIRRFSPRPIDGHTQEILLRAAFAAPASENAQTRRFIVIAQRDRLDQLPALHPSAGPAREAPLAILLCCDTSASPQTVFWPQDCAAAAENLMLAARALGIGSLWCGIHPVEAREQAFMKAFGLPGMVRPAGLVLLGYPLQDFFEENRYDPHLVRSDTWTRAYETEY